MVTIQCALNRDLLLESEKKKLYFAFDTKELLRGDMAQRFAAYKTALDANFMQIDEVRYAEDLEPLGLDWIKLGLQDVLYNPKTKELFTPNTGITARMDGQKAASDGAEPEEPLQNAPEGDTMEERTNPPDLELRYNDRHGPDGKFASKGGKAKHKTKYAPSKQQNFGRIEVSPKKYGILCGVFRTKYPNASPGDGSLPFNSGLYKWYATGAENGGMTLNKRFKIKQGGSSWF